jgi:predicted deacetylase
VAEPKRLLVSLHDVSPFHRDRIERAEQLLTSLGIPTVTYLLVPDFHGAAPAHASDAFVAWCRTSRGFNVHWFLHGYFHRARAATSDRGRQAIAEALAARCLTAGEGEFLGLRGERLRDRLQAGVRSFERCLGTPPAGFVAPAWLFSRDLIPMLAEMQFRFTESQLRVFQLQTGRARTSPVITWATRTPIRRYGSFAAARLQRLIWRTHPVLRVALHPYDFDDRGIVASIARTIDLLRRTRVISAYSDALFDPRSPAGPESV